MKFMFNKNKGEDKMVFVNLEEYERLEKTRIDQSLRSYEAKHSLELEQKHFDAVRKLETCNDYEIMESRKKFFETKDSLNKELWELKQQSKELEIKNSVSKERETLSLEYVNQTLKIKNTEIELLKSNHVEAIKDKNEIIELLKTQVEVLTAKLTEIKISDAHIHVETVAAKK